MPKSALPAARKVFEQTLLLLGLCGSGLLLAQSAARPPHPYVSEKPLTEPRLFAPGVVSTGEYDSHPA